MKKLFNRELIIGACVIVALAILFFGIDYLKGINLFKAANYYYVSYTNVAGLTQSAPVTVNGFKVGLVREIKYEYDNPGHVLVELSLDKELRIPKGTKAVIASDLLGTASIELQMAKNANYHEIGDKLEGANASGLMDNVSGELMPKVVAMMPKIDSMLIAANGLVADPALARSIQHLEQIMANLETTTALLATTMKNISPAAQQFPQIAGNVNELSKSLAEVATDLKEVSKTIKTMPLDSTMANINRITANLNDVTAQLNDPNSSLGLLLRDPGLYNNLNNSAAHIDSILVDLKRQPKRYIPSIKIF